MPPFLPLLQKNECYTSLVAANPDGRVFASAPAARQPMNISDRLWFKEAIQARDLIIGESQLGRISGKYNLIFAYPVFDEAGQLKVILSTGIDLFWLSRLIEKSNLPLNTSLILTNKSGRVLYHHPEPLKYIDEVLPKASIIRAMTVQGEGVTEGYGLMDDALRLFGFTTVGPTSQGIFLAVGIPKEAAFAEINKYLRRDLIGLGLIALVALAVAWIAGDLFIQREANKLLGVTQRLGHGELTARTGPPYRSGELGLLAQAFDQMADSLVTRQRELQEALEELHLKVMEVNERTVQLEAANKELEAFSYSVSHDLRAPLRGIDGFARALLEDYGDRLNEEGKRYLDIIRSDTKKMGRLIDDLLALSRLGRKEIKLAEVNMDKLARVVIEEVQALSPERAVQVKVKPMPPAWADQSLIRQVLVNLLLNAFKFTKSKEVPLIEVWGWSEENQNVYAVQDNGVGFDMAYADKLFGVFQRLHREEEFEGTGVGLAIVQRIIQRHGGKVWAEGKINEGATLYFALPH